MLDSVTFQARRVSQRRLQQRRVDRRTALAALLLLALVAAGVWIGGGDGHQTGVNQVRELSAHITETLAAFEVPELPRH